MDALNFDKLSSFCGPSKLYDVQSVDLGGPITIVMIPATKALVLAQRINDLQWIQTTASRAESDERIEDPEGFPAVMRDGKPIRREGDLHLVVSDELMMRCVLDDRLHFVADDPVKYQRPKWPVVPPEQLAKVKDEQKRAELQAKAGQEMTLDEYVQALHKREAADPVAGFILQCDVIQEATQGADGGPLFPGKPGREVLERFDMETISEIALACMRFNELIPQLQEEPGEPGKPEPEAEDRAPDALPAPSPPREG